MLWRRKKQFVICGSCRAVKSQSNHFIDPRWHDWMDYQHYLCTLCLWEGVHLLISMWHQEVHATGTRRDMPMAPSNKMNMPLSGGGTCRRAANQKHWQLTTANWLPNVRLSNCCVTSIKMVSYRDERTSTSLINPPKKTSSDFTHLVEANSPTAHSKLERG